MSPWGEGFGRGISTERRARFLSAEVPSIHVLFGWCQRKEHLDFFAELLKHQCRVGSPKDFPDELQEGFGMRGLSQTSHGARGRPVFNAGTLHWVDEQGMV